MEWIFLGLTQFTELNSDMARRRQITPESLRILHANAVGSADTTKGDSSKRTDRL
jgi:hypothetical protein